MGYWKTVSVVALGVFIGGIFVLPASFWDDEVNEEWCSYC